ncbi:low temperature requirement protein A [Bosea sp. BIWAKO-01]|uniref:low temperature requirement protein A n=1 Tax=Bosea sp. BIWAKO-01 TaxID=506668 RepID=UPI000853B3EA|nr:low temperature requirement protein A [Bosea sp. BIWAKO-01]GAU82297.1 hypothetical protein BIWAKO_02207 [Bosea sp. BIWAKO-01]
MTQTLQRRTPLRTRVAHEHAKVSFVELFFDLVFVFAITQISHTLLEHFSLLGLAQAALLLGAVWWAWVCTSWVTNWLDPDSTPVRLMLFVLMFIGLALTTSLPGAFEDRGLIFACAYVAIQLGRSVFTLISLRGRSPANYRNFQRICLWFALSGVFWIIGGLADGGLRFGFWTLALALEYGAPWIGFRVPGLGRSSTAEWDIEGAHLAERCALFIIIALGESVLVTGATAAKLAATLPNSLAFANAFLGSVAMWWLYFHVGAERGSQRISTAEDPGSLARSAYTFIPLPLVAGIILVAVGDEFVLAHPAGHTELKVAIAVIVGPIFYVIGNLLFKKATAGWYPLSHLVGLGLLILWAPTAAILPPLALSFGATLILVLVAAWETLSLRPKEA